MADFIFPQSLAACADLLFEVRARRLEAQKVTDQIAAEESALKEHLINELPKGEASGISGKLARVSIVTKTIVKVEDWPEFYKYIAKKKAFDMLQRRVSDKAVQDRWEKGEVVPGTSPFNIPTISINQLKG